MDLGWSPLLIAFACCVLSTTLAQTQDSSQKRLVFSGVIDGAQSREFPLQDFDVGPSMDRWRTNDDLNVRIEPIAGGLSKLTLTFVIDVNGQSPLGMRGKFFSFRWGKAIGASSTSIHGQFTDRPDLCSELAGMLNSNVLKMKSSISEEIHGPLEVSSSCDPDDIWGTSMEIVLTGDLLGSLVLPVESSPIRK